MNYEHYIGFHFLDATNRVLTTFTLTADSYFNDS